MRRICIFLVVFIGCMCVVQSCPLPIYDAYVEVYVENNTGDTIYVYPATGDSCFSQTRYPDTLLPRNSFLEAGQCFLADIISDMRVAPHATEAVWGKDVEGVHYWEHKPYDKCFRKLNLDTLSFFFINADTLRRYGYDYMAEHK